MFMCAILAELHHGQLTEPFVIHQENFLCVSAQFIKAAKFYIFSLLYSLWLSETTATQIRNSLPLQRVQYTTTEELYFLIFCVMVSCTGLHSVSPEN
jgi:hypothetical protein